MNTETEARTVRTVVQEHIGEASMQWEHVEGAGVFDDRGAADVAERLIAALRLDGDEEISKCDLCAIGLCDA